MTNPKAGHTSASGMTNGSQGLRDGDGLTSPSLTTFTRVYMVTVYLD